jgi:hypothetical protein
MCNGRFGARFVAGAWTPGTAAMAVAGRQHGQLVEHHRDHALSEPQSPSGAGSEPLTPTALMPHGPAAPAASQILVHGQSPWNHLCV